MIIFPAVDIQNGQAVRLRQGRADDATVFAADPVAAARDWEAQGARWLHVVDLDGAFDGQPKSRDIVRNICAALSIPVQLGGGIRDLDTIERYLDHGLSYIIVGTAAVKNPGFLQDACGAFPGQIIVGLDARDGRVATDGWSKLSRHDVIELGKKYEEYGVEAIIYTDIGRDGMMGGVNVDATVRLARAVKIPVIASGGVHDIRDIEALCAVQDEGIEGVICGRSIYEGTLDPSSAPVRADELSEQ